MSEPATVSERAARAQRLVTATTAPGKDVAALDTLVADSAKALDAPAAHLSLLTDRQVTGSAWGSAAGAERGHEVAFDDTVCANALRTGEALVIEDARSDARVSSIPAVLAGHVRAYLGIPLHSAGDIVGVLCVTDTQVRVWTDADLATLEASAYAVQAELDRLAAS